MVQRRDLNAPPRRKMAETVRLLKLAAQQGKTGASGVKDFGENGDAIWTNPDGTTTSVREIPPQIQEAKDSIEAAEGQIQDAKDSIAAEIAAREAALADALDQLAQLDGKLGDLPDSAELEAVRQQVAAAQAAVEAAQADATAAQQAVQAAADQAADAQAAADTANANALAAAGIAADKGRIFYQADAPTGDDRSPNNLWIDSDNGRVHVWNGTTWEESQSEDLRDAAQAAVAAQQAAEAADQKAQDAAAAAAAADQKAQAAQGAAEAAQQAAAGAQQTADDAVLDAREAHNEAVAAQERVQAKIDAGDSLVFNGSFENGDLGWPAGGSHSGRSRIFEDPEAHSGKHSLELIPRGGNVYPESDFYPVRPGGILYFRAWVKRVAGENVRVRLLTRQHTAEKAYISIKYAGRGGGTSEWNDADLPLGEWVLVEGDVLVPENSHYVRAAVWAASSDTLVLHADDLFVTDVTEARAAAQAAEEARQLAAGKPDMDDVQQAITVSANGKNAITVSTAAPTSSTPGVALGDTWWQVNAAGDIFGQWMWNNKWTARTIRSEVIANLDVGKLTVTGTSRFTEAVVDRLFADIFTAHKITANEITIAALDKNGNLEPGSVRGVHIGDGQVSANKITIVGNPNDPAEAGLVANIASIMKLAVENLVVTEGAEINEGVILKLASEMITAGVLRTAEAGQRVVIDETGIVMYGLDPDGVEFELVRIGPSGENLITIGDTTISPDGVRAPRGTFDELSIGGDDLGTILDASPKGIVAWGELREHSSYDTSLKLQRRAELQTRLRANRLYRVSVSARYISNAYNAATWAVDALHYSYDSVPIFPDNLRPGSYQGTSGRHLVQAGLNTVPAMEFFINTEGHADNRVFWAMYSLASTHVSAGVRIYASNSYPMVMSIEDIGPAQDRILKRWNDNNGGGSQDTTPTIVRRTDTWGAGGFGGDVRNGTVYQGTYSSYGNRYGGWVFSSTMRSALSGSTIEKLEVYLENAHWYYGSGGTASIYPNNGSYKGIVGSGITSPNWPRYAGRWVTLPSSWYASIANGTYKGVSTYTTNTGLTYYGQFKGSPTKFRATYRK